MLANGAVILFALMALASERRRFRHLLPGARRGRRVTVLQLLGTLIVTRYHGADDTYGTFAASCATQLAVPARPRTLMGAELNGVLAHRLWPRTITQDAQPTDGDARSVALDEHRVRRDERFVNGATDE